jgi:hypothetical protein
VPGKSFTPNVRSKNSKANADILPEREERFWTFEEDLEGDMWSEQGKDLGHEVEKKKNKKNVKVWTGSMCLRVGSNGWLL